MRTAEGDAAGGLESWLLSRVKRRALWDGLNLLLQHQCQFDRSEGRKTRKVLEELRTSRAELANFLS